MNLGEMVDWIGWVLNEVNKRLNIYRRDAETQRGAEALCLRASAVNRHWVDKS